MESVEYEPAWSLGANCGNDNIASVAKMIDLANDHGFDAIEIGDVLATYMEASAKGWTNGTGGLRWGDYMEMIEVMAKVAYRKDVGNILADGVVPTARHFGHPEIAMEVKGQGIPAYDPRGLKGMGQGYATSNRDACHLRGYSPASELGLIPLKTDPLAWQGKGDLLKLLQDLFAFMDSLDVCKFSSFAEGAEEYAAQYTAMDNLNGFREERNRRCSHSIADFIWTCAIGRCALSSPIAAHRMLKNLWPFARRGWGQRGVIHPHAAAWALSRAAMPARPRRCPAHPGAPGPRAARLSGRRRPGSSGRASRVHAASHRRPAGRLPVPHIHATARAGCR